MPQKIERQFLLTELPDNLEDCPKLSMRQGYLSVSEEREVRIREEGDRYTLTVKTGQGAVREEIETPLQRQQFEDLWPATEDKRLIKTRYFFPLDDLTVHIDIYADKLESLKVAEVEFSSEAACNAFVPPEFFGEEVTSIGGFFHLNKVLEKL